MSGIGGIGGMAGGGNPLSGMAGAGGLGGGGGLSGLGDGGLGLDNGSSAGDGGGNVFGVQPKAATDAQGAAFGDTLRAMVIDNPSASRAQATDMAARFAAGDKSIDPHTIAIASAKAGVEIQMATRTISSAVSAVRTLFQMQV
jgi:flagellar hook-basal body complex protein FliE